MRPRAASLAIAVTAAALAAGCGKRPSMAAGPSPEVTGLAAVPSTAEVIVGLDAGRLAESPIVTRAIGMLLAREAELAGRWQALRESCKLEVKQVNRAMIALGPAPPGGRFGTGPMLLIATGKIVEADLVKCVRDIVGKGGGSLVVQPGQTAPPPQAGASGQPGQPVQSRTLYQVKDGNRSMFIAFGRPDTVILGNNEAYVQEAVGTGQKALANPELAQWIRLVDQGAPVWIIGRAADRLKAGLIRASNNTLKSGAKAFAGSFDLTTGLAGELAVLMESAEDAKRLASLLNANLVGMSWAAQAASLAKVVQKISIQPQGDRVRVRVPLTMDDVNRVLNALDGEQAPAQDSPPAAGSAPPPPAP